MLIIEFAILPYQNSYTASINRLSTPELILETFKVIGRSNNKNRTCLSNYLPSPSRSIYGALAATRQALCSNLQRRRTNSHPPADVHLASLFAFHRPISVSDALPTPKTEKDFSQIFSPSHPPAKQSTAQVIFTLASAVKSLETVTKQRGHDRQPQDSNPQLTPAEQDLREAVTQASQSNASPSAETRQAVLISIEELAKNFRPFHPPPPPVPMADRLDTETQVLDHSAQEMSRLAAVVDELSLPDSPPQPSVVPRQPFLNRMRIRFWKREEAMRERRQEIYRAISVKRQRRLKMKKHKYKKLMRRTRNLRRRQDRL
ncbi:MAG: hypothetical protein LQ340_006202 [Diploschistes diacapsis]|nr:MAG: hypothetical protein LQ340_006202 [Diploschistes diacapsis]